MTDRIRHVGPKVSEEKTQFTVWAPLLRDLSVIIGHEEIPMKRDGEYFVVTVDHELTGTEYLLKTENGMRPDPASRFQPSGVDGPSMVVDPSRFPWKDENWHGIHISDMIIYEMHVGTFTEKGTFAAVEEKLPYLKEIGINAIELMPVSQTYGSRNWGYDGVFPYSVNRSYGTLTDLMHLVDACHRSDMAIIMDVVYNHLGPIGNVLPDFGPYISDRYVTPWGRSMNFDSSYSEGVRNYFLGNALYFLRDLRFDGLRLDSVQNIFDRSPKNFLQSLADLAMDVGREQGREITLIAESDENNSSLITDQSRCGMGIDAMWCDDFHHAFHSYLTGERVGYYSDYGDFNQIPKTLSDGFVYDGIYSNHLHRIRGTEFSLEPWKLVVFAQNHDQIGNRPLGDRLLTQIGEEKYRVVVAAVLLSPFTPMLFMGEERGETSPFLFFVDPPDEVFGRLVDEGRRKELGDFHWPENIPYPSRMETFLRSRIRWDHVNNGLLRYFHDVIGLRRRYLSPEIRSGRKVSVQDHSVVVSYGDGRYLLHINVGGEEKSLDGEIIMNSNSPRYGGSGDPTELGSFGAAFSVHG